MQPSATRTHGWAMLDAIIGITAIGVIVIGLIAASSQQRRAGRAMADQRQLVRDAEVAATQLQMGGEVTVADTVIESVDDGWVRITVQRNGRSAELLALEDAGGVP